MTGEYQLINQMNKDLIVKAIADLEVINYESVSELLPELLASKQLKLDHSIYQPVNLATAEACGIGRFLIYDHQDEKNPFSIWVFAFAKLQKTSIHDHLYKGTVSVLQGPITEKFYQPTEGMKAKLVGCIDRPTFHTNRDDLNGFFVHQLKRRKGIEEGFSVTLHIYNMAAHVIGPDGGLTDRRNLSKIYTKDKPAKEKENTVEQTENSSLSMLNIF
ncbi:putative metal-dependent enzyme of the double-stranded beta helix superfamily protein [Legionella massiliensis]|uniref:Putative metal-dependent enzyme of the double-stranded beta helix superfamily protein n=1 Tax=Legionella massiliensis TaxID=1034943 RepID=A0A078KTY1_9GAMM|nr:cysteine dioxygenase [Legionella massiliensis]CDZ76496.1 putative metal-dependent enzyme of the double-stranded beta helix superfamily protein [Legionella massiliensis]CEE12234.1 hypothetical protein BN1094_00765 [Legionella massiliensis]